MKSLLEISEMNGKGVSKCVLVSWSPQGHPWFRDFLEGCTGSSVQWCHGWDWLWQKALKPHLWMEKAWGVVWRKPGTCFQGLSPHRVTQDVFHSQQCCVVIRLQGCPSGSSVETQCLRCWPEAGHALPGTHQTPDSEGKCIEGYSICTVWTQWTLIVI